MTTIVTWAVILGLGVIVIVRSMLSVGKEHDRRQDRILRNRYRGAK